tara:strand:+ start:3212 stop:3664 length:453 start_codon:yes stop_codon:yes gene_type:complete
MNFPTVSRGQADKGFTVVYNNEGGELIPGVVCEFDLTATTAEQGYYVEKVDIVVNATTGIAAPLAGVVTNTIATASVGRLQVYGPCAVTVTGTVVAGSVAVATSAGAAPTAVGITHVAATTTNVAYAAAALGVSIEAVSANQSIVQLQIM